MEVALGLIRTAGFATSDVGVLSLQERGFFDATLEQAGMRVWHVPRRIRLDISVPFRIRAVIKAFRPDIVHSFSALTSFVVSLFPMSRETAFIENSVQNAFSMRGLAKRSLCRWIFRRGDLIVGNSHLGLAAKHAPTAKSAVLYNGYDFRRQRCLTPPQDTRKALGLGSAKTVAMVASFCPHKDWSTFFKAAHLVHERRKDVVFLAIGDGSDRARWEATHRNRGYIKFLGWRTDIEDIQNVCDVGVLCSPSEGVPNAVLEFMALGKPTVTACGGAVSELVEHGRTGMLVTPGRAQEVADTICALLDDGEMAQEMGKRARRVVEEKFSSEVMIRSLLQIYQWGLELRGIGPRRVESGAASDRCVPSADRPPSRRC